MIRRILVDQRGGDAVHLALDEAIAGAHARGVEMFDLDHALQSL